MRSEPPDAPTWPPYAHARPEAAARLSARRFQADDAKLKLQAYVTGCYGSLTSSNVLFADEDDQFKGAGGDQG